MAVRTRTCSSGRLAAGLSALSLGVTLLAMPGTALAQQDDHRRDGGGGQREQHERSAPAAQAPAPQRATPPAGRGGDGRTQGQFGGQYRQAPSNSYGNNGGYGNGGQGRQQQPNSGSGQGRPAFQGQRGYQGQFGFQGQARGDNPGHDDRGQWRNNGRHDDAGRNDNGRNDNGRNDAGRNDNGRNDGGHYDSGRNYGGRHDGGRYDGGSDRGSQYGYGRSGGGQWNHGWRQDNRYDWRGWRDQNRDTFHVGRYYPPYRDYSYSRLEIGISLQSVFFGSDYWIADPYDYHLPPAYGPYHWVRYYNDAVLVNTYNGQVADVIYDFFW